MVTEECSASHTDAVGACRYCVVMTQNPDVRPSTPIALAGLRAGVDVGGYRLLRRLGAGGMGVVWEVADAEGRRVAMKILHPQIAADPMARRRLDREASVLARVRDSRVARILDIETGDGADGSGVTFVITELVDGPTLQHEVDHEGAYDLTVDARDLADLAHGLVDALSAVHAAGVIHRDLKPSNVMLGAQGPVLIDFGIAQVADDVRLTQTGQVTGTPGFIPPEMLDGGEPDPGVDWYACAGVLLFAVTGRAPFGTGPWQAVFRRVYAGTPELGSLEEEWPALARAFTATLAPEVADRLPVGDLLAVLDDIAEGGTGEEVIAGLLGDEATLDDFSSFDETRMGASGGDRDPAALPAPAPSGAAPVLPGPAGRSSTPSAPSGSDAGSAPYGHLSAPVAPAPPGYPPSGRPVGPGEAPPPAFTPSHNGWGAQGVDPRSMQAAGASSAAPAPSGAYRTGSGPVPAPSAPVRTPTAPPASGPGRRTGPAALPQWALEPRRHPVFMVSLGLFLVAIGITRPVWVMIIAAVGVLIAGTVGRADDARRWRRLQAGRVSPNDNSRMWAGVFWYLLRSLASTAGALVVAGVLSVITLYIGARLIGGHSVMSVTLVTSLTEYHKVGILMAIVALEYLVVMWMVPWGTPTRRGGARTVEALTGSDSARLIVTMVLLAAALGMAFLFAVGALPQTSLSPYSGSL